MIPFISYVHDLLWVLKTFIVGLRVMRAGVGELIEEQSLLYFVLWCWPPIVCIYGLLTLQLVTLGESGIEMANRVKRDCKVSDKV